MDYLSFGKIAIKPTLCDDFVKEATAKGIHVQHIKANIYDFGIKLPSLMDQNHLRKTAGLLGLKYSED